MFLSRQADQLRHIYDEYPNQFWTLVLATFIDRLGGALLYPFFTLHITRKFGVGMTQVGLLFGLFSAAGLVHSPGGHEHTGHHVPVGLAAYEPVEYVIIYQSRVHGRYWQAC